MQLEVEQARELLREVTYREAQVRNEVKTLTDEIAGQKSDAKSLHSIVDEVRGQAMRKEEELCDLRPTCERLKAELNQVKVQFQEIEADAKRVYGLQVNTQMNGLFPQIS